MDGFGSGGVFGERFWRITGISAGDEEVLVAPVGSWGPVFAEPEQPPGLGEGDDPVVLRIAQSGELGEQACLVAADADLVAGSAADEVSAASLDRPRPLPDSELNTPLCIKSELVEEALVLRHIHIILTVLDWLRAGPMIGTTSRADRADSRSEQETTVTTNKQADANKRNAKKSTGPKSTEGKERSSRNAVKHSAYAEELYPLARGPLAENPEEFRGRAEELLRGFDPQDPLEAELAKRGTKALMTLQRLDRFESMLVDQEGVLDPLAATTV